MCRRGRKLLLCNSNAHENSGNQWTTASEPNFNNKVPIASYSQFCDIQEEIDNIESSFEQ